MLTSKNSRMQPENFLMARGTTKCPCVPSSLPCLARNGSVWPDGLRKDIEKDTEKEKSIGARITGSWLSTVHYHQAAVVC